MGIGNTNMTGKHFATGPMVNIEIAGTAPKTEYGQISLAGKATIESTTALNVTLAGGFVPSPGQSFEIIVVRGTLTGDFGVKNFPQVSGVGFTTSIVTAGVYRKYVLRTVAA